MDGREDTSRSKQIRRCQEICRQHGLPLTPQRRVVLDAMLGRTDHPSADRVYEEAKDRLPGLSRMTVYRNLHLLTELGILKRMHPLSSVRFDPNTRPHHHLVCVQCEKVMDLPEDPRNAIEMPGSAVRGFQARDYQLYYLGTCAACRRQARARGRAAGAARGREPRRRR